MAKSSERPRVLLVNRCFVQRKDGKLLLLKRSKENRYFPLHWECPGGKLDVGQDLAHALEREVLEETGLLFEPTHRLVCVASEIVAAGPYRGLPYVIIFSVGRAAGGKLKLSEEHSAHTWVSYHEAFKYQLKPEVRKALIVLKSLLQ